MRTAPFPGRAMLIAPPAAAAPAVVVHDAAGAERALTLAGEGGVILLSAPGAAGSLGAAWFLALVRGAAERAPRRAAHRAALDCGDAPGHALAALRAGARLLILDPAIPAFAAVESAAAEVGAELWTARPPALDLAGLDLRRARDRDRLVAWLGGAWLGGAWPDGTGPGGGAK